LPVTFTLTDPSQRYQFEIDTIIDGYSRNEISVDIPNQPPVDDNFYEQIKNNNVFIYGSDFGIYDSTPVDNATNQHGTILISNLNQGNLLFTGNNEVSVSNIYINKKGQEIIFRSSTKLGAKNTTDIVRIEGNVQLNNGGSRIYANTVYIDGNVTFGSSAIIDARKVIITGDVTFKNWDAYILADEVYIGGTVAERHENVVGVKIERYQLDNGSIPKSLQLSSPSFQEDRWYTENGYEVKTNGDLS